MPGSSWWLRQLGVSGRFDACRGGGFIGPFASQSVRAGFMGRLGCFGLCLVWWPRPVLYLIIDIMRCVISFFSWSPEPISNLLGFLSALEFIQDSI